MKKLYRNINLTKSVDVVTLEDGVTAVPVAISSEAPYLRDRLNGHAQAYEVLSHESSAVNMSYLLEGAPLCFEHDTRTQIGVLRNVRIDPDKVLRADAVFSKSQFAQEILQDVLDSIRTRISVGYSVEQYEDAGLADDGLPIVVATRWTPYESSIVSIPADLSIGVNKSMKKNFKELVADLSDDEKEELLETLQDDTASEGQDVSLGDVVEQVVADMAEEPEATQAAEDVPEETTTVDENVDAEDDTEESEDASSGKKTLLIDVSKRTKMSRTQEKAPMNQQEIEKITTLAVKHNATEKLAGWLSEGKSYNDVAVEILETRDNSKKVGAPAVHTRTKTTSVGGAVKDWLRGENSEIAEKGLDQARNHGTSIQPNTLYIPTNEPIFARNFVRTGTVYGGAGTGAAGVGKEFMTWEETLRESSLIARIGGQAIVLNDIGHVPYFGTATSATMAAETGSLSESAGAVLNYSWTPKRIGARYSFSNLMGKLNGTYDFETELYNDLVAEGIRKLDSQVWGGTGANNITGLQYDSNIGTMTTSGSFSLASGSAMRSYVANNNVNVDEGVFVLAHKVFGDVFADPAFGAGSGKSTLEVLQSQNPVYGTGFLAQPLTPKYAAMFLVPRYVTVATFGALEVTRDNLTALADGKTILNLDLYADSVCRQPGAAYRWHNID